MAFAHEFAWSASRARGFGECKRMHYHQYYGGWRGWDREEPEERQRTYMLGKLQRMPMLAGSIVHLCLARYFHAKPEERMDARQMAEAGAEMLREKFRESQQGLWRNRPAKYAHLAEHHYQEDTVRDRAAVAEYGTQYVKRIGDCVRGFFESPDLAWLREASPDSYVYVEEEGQFDSFEFEDTKVFGTPDFALQDPQGIVHLYDWKTGKPSEENDAFQLHVYALYAELEWEVPLERFRAYDAYLESGKVVACPITPESLEETRSRIRASIEAMRELHFDADRETRSPTGFPQIPIDSPEARHCRRCRFRELCER